VIETVEPSSESGAQEENSVLRDWGVLRDIPFRLLVEVGRTKMQVRDILNLELGSLVVTSKLSGEPMDISLDTEIFGRAEIIIIKDKLWARLTKVVGDDG
jgi:flagellar motor switch protein FliN/FliY